ncbi:MAG TPA: hypothetical protein VF269_04235 [Rhodanobacteraceae bacterium]
MKHPHTDHFADRARTLYLRAGPHLDTTTAARLRAARRSALDTKPQHHALRWMVPTGACAAALLAALTIWQPLQHPATVATMAPTSADVTQALPPDVDQTNPALYQNLDFYAWLAHQPATKASATSGH